MWDSGLNQSRYMARLKKNNSTSETPKGTENIMS